MAFDRPLQADRVDDLGLVSSFIRAPIVGPIMWLLGGSMAIQIDEEEKRKVSDDLLASLSDDDSSTSSSDAGGEDNQGNQTCSSSNSDSIGETSTDGSTTIDSCGIPPLSDQSSSKEGKTHGLTRSKAIGCFNKTKKKTSWSDERGRDLVEYMGEPHTAHLHPSSKSANVSADYNPHMQPIKSAMKKSTSFQPCGKTMGPILPHPSEVAELIASSGRRQSPTSKSGDPRHPCIPSGLVGGANNGLIMPSGGGMVSTTHRQENGEKSALAGVTSQNGYVSPQWGWYISTTPPTPEQYYTSSQQAQDEQRKNSGKEGVEVLEKNPLRMRPLKTSPPSHHSPVLTRNVNRGKAASGWPSVPL